MALVPYVGKHWKGIDLSGTVLTAEESDKVIHRASDRVMFNLPIGKPVKSIGTFLVTGTLHRKAPGYNAG
jgi:hypothetical protein